MNDWIRNRLLQSENKTIFVGDKFNLIIPKEFQNSIPIVVNDLREIFCENVYSRYLPFSTAVCGDDVILDCGANIGSFSVWAATRNKEARIIAIEPDQEIGRALIRNLELNGLTDRVHLEKVCVSDRKGKIALARNVACFTMTKMATDATTSDSAETISVTSMDTIDAIVERLQLERLDFIKMDVEGAERLALQGGAETIRRFHPRLAISGYHLCDDIYVLAGLICELYPDYDIFISNDLYIYASADRSLVDVRLKVEQ